MANIPPMAEKPKIDTRKFPQFSIKGTSCCGMHELSGFQHTRDPVCEDFFIGIQRTYNKAHFDYENHYAPANVKAERGYFNLPLEQRDWSFGYPYQATPFKAAGMLIFTWNHVGYDAMAKKLAAYITEQKLGSTVFTGKTRNPNSENMIEGMIWLIDQAGWRRFQKTHREAIAA